MQCLRNKLIGTFHFLCVSILLLSHGCSAGTLTVRKEESELQSPPVAEKVPYTHTAHGHDREDHYFWMRDDERKDSNIIKHLKAENAYAKSVLAPTLDLQKHLFDELKGRLKKDDRSVPTKRRNYWYYSRVEAGKEFPIYCRKLGSLEAEEEVLLDENKLAEGHDYYSLGGYAISENEHILAYAEDTLSRRIFTIRFIDLRTGKHLPDVLTGASTSMAWASDNETFFYVDKDDKTLRPFAVRRHVLGSIQTSDVTVHEESDESFYVSVDRSKSRRFVMIDLESTNVSEVRFIEASEPLSAFRSVTPRKANVEYGVEHHGDTFYILTNEGALNFKLMAAPIATSQDHGSWATVIPARSEAMLDGIEVFEHYLVVGEREFGQRQLRVIEWSTKASHDIEFGENVYTAFTGSNPEFETETVRLVYGGYNIPTTVVDYNMRTRTKTVLKRDEVLGGFEPGDYTAKKVWVTARDGAKIPMSVILPKGFKKDSSHPVYQYAYGSYGYSIDPWFRSSWISLLDRGFVVAVPHVRGGETMGRGWYNDGKMFNKINTFTDYIDCSEYLIANKYTSADNLVAAGGSAGGLLMGAVANMRPDLYRVMHAAVPFVDVVTTMLDASIPLTTNEYEEWGNPNIKSQYDYILSYSPYDQVKVQAYPNLIVTTGFHDSQVQYWEPMKWVARLRELKTDRNVLIFDTEMETGHSGASGRFKRYEQTAMVFSFFMQTIDPNLERWFVAGPIEQP